MSEFIFAYHGGSMPESEEEGARVMAQWGAWMEGLGSAIVNPGAPVGDSKTVHSDGVNDDGGANPLSGFTVVKADTIDAAIKMAQGCPVLQSGGTVEVAPVMQM